MLEWVTLISGLVFFLIALYGYNEKKSLEYIIWSISGLTFLIIAIALVAMSLDALSLPYTVYLGSIYPSFLALGLLYKKEGYWKYYLYFIILMIILIAAGQVALPQLKVGAQVALHAISGLIIVFLPIIEVLVRKEWHAYYLLFSLGGIVIGIGGLALASIVAGAPILPFELVVMLLHPLLFISAFLIALGIYLITQL